MVGGGPFMLTFKVRLGPARKRKGPRIKGPGYIYHFYFFQFRVFCYKISSINLEFFWKSTYPKFEFDFSTCTNKIDGIGICNKTTPLGLP